MIGRRGLLIGSTPVIGHAGPPDLLANAYNPSKYKAYLEQLAIKYPTLRNCVETARANQPQTTRCEGLYDPG